MHKIVDYIPEEIFLIVYILLNLLIYDSLIGN